MNNRPRTEAKRTKRLPVAWNLIPALLLLLSPPTAAGEVPGPVPAPRLARESARNIPVAYEVDVVVVGGSTGAVAAATAASKEGARVFLAAPFPYLGDDMTATLRLWLEEGEVPEDPLAQALFPPESNAGPRRSLPTPLHVKKVLDQALLAAGVEYLYSSYVTDVLRDEKDQPAGVVIANRAGRQAVVAKVIVDATPRAAVAELAGARCEPFPRAPRELRWVVVGGEPRSGEGIRSRVIGPPFIQSGQKYDLIEYSLEVGMEDGSCASWARAEQIARERTYHPDQQFTSDILFQLPPDPIRGQTRAPAEWRGVKDLDLRAFRPEGVSRLLVVGGRADVPRDVAARLLRPLALIELGERIGAAAVREAKALPPLRGVHVGGHGRKVEGAVDGEVREALTGVRPVQSLPVIPQGERALPVLGNYDVVVIGGGTSGAPAGIAAARRGARTLVVEYLHGLGGVGTQGAISKYYWGNRVGFSAQVEGGASWRIESRMEWWRKTLREAGAEVWLGAMGCGAFAVGGRIAGAVVVTPQGRGVVLAKVVIDATGNADVAAAAGANCLYTDATDIAMQGTGLPPRNLGESYTNTDFTIVDETDMVDVWSVFVYAKEKAKAEDTFDLGKLIDTRERRRIVGDLTITILDAINDRTYPDAVVVCHSDFDTHGYTIDPYFTLDHPPHRKGFYVRIPYRALLPKGIEGIIVTGLGISAHRDAVPLVRMQPDVQNQGYAAGVAAAMAATEGKGLRGIDVRALQRHLVEIGNLPSSVLSERDSHPMPPERIAQAVQAAGEKYADVAVILAHPDQALPLLRRAYAASESKDRRLVYAHILAVLGDPSGVPELIAQVEAIPGLDKGWHYTGQGQYGPNMSPLDRLIYALGRARDPRATAPILDKLRHLKAEDAFSHFRAMALALEALGDPVAAGPLAEILAQPGIRGHAVKTIQGALDEARRWPSWNATEPRSNAIRELILARALYLCGDQDGLGRAILEEYVKDLRGHLSRHANAVLERRKKLD